MPHSAPRHFGNLADLVREAASRTQDAGRIALRWQDRALTWAELDAAVDAAARGLLALELPRPDRHPPRVALALPNTPAFVIAFFAAMRAGLAVLPVNPGLTAREMRHVLADSAAAVLLAAPRAGQAIATVVDGLPDLRHHYVNRGGADLADLPIPGGPVTASAGGEDLAVLLYTSGTEGDPKGAMLSHRALLANQAQIAALRPPPVGPDDVVLLALPLFHGYGLNSGLGAVAYHAACGVLVERFDPAETADLVARHRVTTLVGVPSMFLAWSLLPPERVDFGSVRTAISGAAPLDPAIGDRFAGLAGCAVAEGYGLTETAPVLTSTLASPAFKPGSVGRPIPGVRLKLVAADGDTVWCGDGGPLPEREAGDGAGAGVPEPAGTAGPDDAGAGLGDDDFEVAPASPGSDPGEIVVSGANLFSGYWPDGHGRAGDDGWWATGDVGYADADGDLHLIDRIGELILVNGFNVYPHEIERVLMAHPAVQAAAVLGIPHPYTGQTVKAYVVAAGEVTAEELFAYCEQHLARFKCPTAIEFVPRLPYSAEGKVRKAALRGEGHG